MKVILTGLTGYVGEGVFYECLDSPDVEAILAVTRRKYDLEHPKLTQLVVKDLRDVAAVEAQLTGYDACFYCAGVSSAGMSEADYTVVTYDTPLDFAKTLVRLNPQMVMCHLSGASSDSSEKGSVMWGRVKGRAENALMKLPFKGVYNFRAGFMKASPRMRNVNTIFKIANFLSPLFFLLLPKRSSTIGEVGRAMINAALIGYDKQVLEVTDIKQLAAAR